MLKLKDILIATARSIVQHSQAILGGISRVRSSLSVELSRRATHSAIVIVNFGGRKILAMDDLSDNSASNPYGVSC